MDTSAVIDTSAGSASFLARGHGLHRADEAGRVAGSEELLGVGAGAAVAAQFLGRGQVQLDAAVGRLGGAGAAAGGRGGAV
jgi:hypothetical protein